MSAVARPDRRADVLAALASVRPALAVVAEPERLAAFDPQGLLNPGKGVPTLNRCADYGALRVSRGQLPFPDLPRF